MDTTDQMGRAVAGETPSISAAQLNSRQKIAVLLAHLGAQRAALVLKEMSDEETIDLSKAMVGLPPLSQAVIAEVLAEFMDRAGRAELTGQGGIEMARTFLQERLGQTRAQEVMDQIEAQQESSPLSGIVHIDPQQALAVLGGQQPQVVAVLLAYLPPADAASLLSVLDPAFRVKVSMRIARLTRVDPVAIRQASALFAEKLRGAQLGGPTTVAGGTATMAEILNHSDRSIEQQVLGDLELQDAALVEQIRANLFTFDDVMNLEDKSLQQIFRKLDAPTIALVLKEPHLTPEVIAKIRSNISERVTGMIDEELEAMGTVRSAQINAAQTAVVRTARELDAEGIIVIAREDEVVA